MKKQFVLGIIASGLFTSCLFIGSFASAAKSEWSFLTYIQGDNSLDEYAAINITAMQVVGSPAPVAPSAMSAVNVLVQWDKKKDNKTYRYKLLQKPMVVASTLKEMGYLPAQEIVDSMTWVKASYPAKRYALILWDHGNGVLDRSGTGSLFPWIHAPGFSSNLFQSRGLLYDDSQQTFLGVGDAAGVNSLKPLPVAAGLGQSCARVKSVIKQNIDILGMDACLMAMIEVAYQVKDSVNYMVSSQQTEPGIGWEYTASLQAFVENPKATTSMLASAIVSAYKDFYSTGSDADSSFTLSVIDVQKINPAAVSFNNVLTKILAAYGPNNINKSLVNAAMKAARNNTTSFYISDYIDLIDLYDNLSTVFTKLATARGRKHKSRIPRDIKIQQAAAEVVAALVVAKTAAQNAVVASQIGTDYSGAAYGLSIYCPVSGFIDAGYQKTAFALAFPQWLTVLKNLKA